MTGAGLVTAGPSRPLMRLAGWLAVPLVASLLVLVVWPDRREYLAEGIVAWCCLALAREVMGAVTARLSTTWRSPSAHDSVRRRARVTRPAVDQARRAEQIAAVSATDATTVSQLLVPLLRDVADERIRHRRGTDVAGLRADEALTLLGEAGRALLRPDLVPHEGDAGGLPPGTLHDVLNHLDAL